MRSLLDDSVVEKVVRKGYSVDAYELVNKLRARFSMEVCSVLSQSHIFKRRFMKVFTAIPSTDSLMQSIKHGKFNGVAQSDKFLERVKFIKELIDRTLIRAETQNVYLPAYITSAQRSLPIRGNAPLGVLGNEYARMPRSVASALTVDADMGSMLGRMGDRLNGTRRSEGRSWNKSY